MVLQTCKTGCVWKPDFARSKPFTNDPSGASYYSASQQLVAYRIVIIKLPKHYTTGIGYI